MLTTKCKWLQEWQKKSRRHIQADNESHWGIVTDMKGLRRHSGEEEERRGELRDREQKSRECGEVGFVCMRVILLAAAL